MSEKHKIFTADEIRERFNEDKLKKIIEALADSIDDESIQEK